MANTLRIKRRAAASGAGAPSTLANAELAFNEASNVLYYGTGTGGAGGSASSIIAIAGDGAYLGLSSGLTQTAAGTYTFSGGVTFSSTVALGASATATTPAADDSSTAVATTAWVQNEISGLAGGTVTSVGLSLPDIFTVSGSPVTSTGTLSATLASQTQNHVFAAPASGGNGAPAFRALAAADIPDISGTYLPLTGGTLSGSLTVGGDLTINGTVTSVNSTTVTVDDKNIELGSTESPSDATADGGGITLKGTTDKTFNWVDATDAWTSSEHMNLLTGKEYKINGTSVLSATTLGSGVTASSLTSVGTITSGTWSATIDNATIDGGTF
jgi:hypothetical protein